MRKNKRDILERISNQDLKDLVRRFVYVKDLQKEDVQELIERLDQSTKVKDVKKAWRDLQDEIDRHNKDTAARPQRRDIIWYESFPQKVYYDRNCSACYITATRDPKELAFFVMPPHTCGNSIGGLTM